MKRTLSYPIKESEQGCSIESFLRSQGYSRHIISCIKQKEDGVLVDGKRAFTNYRLQAGDVLTIHLTEDASSETIQPVPLPLDIVYEDKDLLILNKAADTPIHPSIHNTENTLANAVAYYYQSRREHFVFRCINRLDRDTTGLLIVAKHILSASILSRMMLNREIHREYLAIASGKLPLSGTICAPIARKEGSLLERCVDFSCGESAVTHYQRICFSGDYSLAAVTLDTGRTHQIRIHMGYIGHPLIGDYLYNPDYRKMKRLSLHSHQLSFSHPITKLPLRFEAPLPQDMQWILDTREKAAMSD